jgi:hypothetical protein
MKKPSGCSQRAIDSTLLLPLKMASEWLMLGCVDIPSLNRGLKAKQYPTKSLK